MLLVKYGEIALKSRNVRRRFEQQLVWNIENMMMERGVTGKVERGRGVMLIYTSMVPEMENILAHTFGVIYYSQVEETSSSSEEIFSAAVKLANGFPDSSTFAVRCKRTGSHKYTSMELAANTGEKILEAYPGKLKVNLTSPDNELRLEVREKKCHIYVSREKGPGGMPVGTQGKALLHVARGREKLGAAAGWLVLKRGVSLQIMLEDGAEDISPLLRPWGGPRDVFFTRPQEDLAETVRRSGAAALVLPDENPQEKPIVQAAVLYPLAGLPKNIGLEIMKKLGFDRP
ncbi:MAG: THUMP domain-containing protein [Candidatus Thermoplasmatota archaeon]|nr:THUMP domain-containing protein [Candidatus Thermoplasmatota archaeon]